MYCSPIRRKFEATRPNTTRLTNDTICHFAPSMNVTVAIVTTANRARYEACNENPVSALSGNSPAPRISSTAKNHSTRFRRGISQVSTGL